MTLDHPCDIAMGLLVGQAPSKTVLLLTDSRASTSQGFPMPHAEIHSVEHHQPAGLLGSSKACVTEFFPDSTEPDFLLPFNSGSFHRVVLVLTCCWPADPYGRTRLLAEIRRVLAADGELLILAQNRYGRHRLKESIRLIHREAGLLANIRAIGKGTLKLLTDGRTLPSLRGLRAMLSKAGLRSTEWFRPLRDPQGCLTEVRPLYPREGEWRAYLPMSGSGRIRKFPQIADEFLIRASVGTLETSVLRHCLQQIACEIAPDFTLEQTVGIEQFLITPKEKVVVMAKLNNMPVVVRIPLSEAAHEGCLRNLRALRVIDAEPVCRGLAPIPLAEGETAGYYYTVESRLNGDPLGRSALGQNGLAQVEFLIQKLNPRSLTRQTILDGALYDELVTTPLNKVLALITEAYKRNRLELFFKDRLLGKQVSVGISHGDFSLSNIFVQDNKITGVIDWDDSCLTGLPIIDAISHLCSRQVRRGGGFSDTFLNLAIKEWPDTDELAFLVRCYTYFRTDPGIHTALVLLFWVNVTAAQIEFWFAKKPAFSQIRIRKIIDIIASDTNHPILEKSVTNNE